MRTLDALKTIFRKKENNRSHTRMTRWSEEADDRRTIPCADYPRPQMTRNEWTCLNGVWEYAFTRIDEFWSRAEGEIIVPFSPETSRSGVNKTLLPGNALWYRREIFVDGIVPSKRLILHFGAVDERCTLWINRRKMGRHQGGYLPFSFDITDAVKEGKNELLLRVLDDTDESEACRGKQKLKPGGMFYTPQSGIWQTVWTEWVPDPYIKKLQVTPYPDLSGSGGEIEIRIFAGAGGGADGEIRIESGESLPPCHFTKEEFDEQGCVTKKVRMNEARLWSPEDPFLYQLNIRMGEDEVRSYFAMRSFGIGKDEAGRPCLTLNGEPYFFHGVLDQGYWPESLMTPPSDEAMVFDIQSMKQLGFNMLRKHVKIEPLRWYYHCDRLGMVVWQDMINGGGPISAPLCTYLPTAVPAFWKMFSDSHYRLLSRTDQKERGLFEKQLLEMVDLLKSEPCIGMWVIFNEGWGQFDAQRLYNEVKNQDPTRPVDHASGWFDQGVGDICSVHNYFRKLEAEKDPSGRPYVISEYGGIVCNISGHSFTEHSYGYAKEAPETFPGHFQALMEEIRLLGKEGLAGAVYTQVSDIEEEENGLLTFDRKIIKTGGMNP